jgi:CRP/FNR family transcriptional regulator, cyclic AMP receptor protein
MHMLSLVAGRRRRTSSDGLHKEVRPGQDTRDGAEGNVYEFRSLIASEAPWDDTGLPCSAEKFFGQLSPEAMSELKSLAEISRCPDATVLIREEQEPRRVMLLLEGRVRLSMNSRDGRRLIVGVVAPGEIVGLISAVSGCPSEINAEAKHPCTILSIKRPNFLNFLLRYPIAGQNVASQLSFEYKRTYEQLRLLGLISTAPAKLAHLLLDWCAKGERTERGIQIRCSLTHGEIGEHVGVSRETVTRSLNTFKERGLVELHGSILIVPNLGALATYAGIEVVPDPSGPAA